MRTWLEVDFDRMKKNIDVVRGVLPEGCDIIAVVKANAYGHGDVAVAKKLREFGVHRFAVACMSEALILRNAGLDGEIIILGNTEGPDAVTAAENGHEVILCEKSGELGGTILCERDVSFKEALHGYIEQQKRKIARLPIDLRLNTPVTHDYAAALKPDAVICAIGSDVAKPPIPGLDLPHVHSAVEVFNDPSLA